jgi:hypothetical protein
MPRTQSAVGDTALIWARHTALGCRTSGGAFKGSERTARSSFECRLLGRAPTAAHSALTPLRLLSSASNWLRFAHDPHSLPHP